VAVEIITKEDLKIFKKELIAELKTAFSKQIQPQKEWLKSHEVIKMLGISVGTLQNMRINGTMQFSKIGAVIYYKSEDIQKMLEANRKK
jgi:hypothetical protein